MPPIASSCTEQQQHRQQSLPAPPVAYSIKGAAETTGFGTTTIYEAIRAGELLSCKYGKRRVILRDDLLAWLSRYREAVL